MILKNQLIVETKQTTYQQGSVVDRRLEDRRAVGEPVGTPVVAGIAVDTVVDTVAAGSHRLVELGFLQAV